MMYHGNVDEQIRRATEVQARYADNLMSKPHVVGVGVGFAKREGQETPEVAVIVMVDEKLPKAQLSPDVMIPDQLDGVRVDVQEMGHFGTF